MVTKRRRVTFSDSVEEAPTSQGAGASSSGENGSAIGRSAISASGSSRAVPRHSLLTDEGAVNGESKDTPQITAFNLADELEGGELDVENDDGIIPTELRSRVEDEDESVHSSSDDDDDREQSLHKANGGTNQEPNSPDEWMDEIEDKSAPAPAYETSDGSNGEGVSRAAAKRQRTKLTKGDGKEDDTVLSIGSCILQLVHLLHVSESSMQAIRRLKKVDAVSDLDKVTELCHALLGHGFFSAYDMTREELLKSVMWELCWTPHRPAPSFSPVHGPFTAANMSAWSNARYFSQPAKRAWVRVVASATEWIAALDVFVPEKT